MKLAAERLAALPGMSQLARRPRPAGGGTVRRLEYMSFDLAPPYCRFLYRYGDRVYEKRIRFADTPEEAFRAADPAVLATLVGHIGLAFVPQLFTLEDFTHLRVGPVALSPLGRELLSELLCHGLAELRLRNGLDLRRQVAIEAQERQVPEVAGAAAAGAREAHASGRGKDAASAGNPGNARSARGAAAPAPSGALLLGGGGKDSAVSAAALATVGEPFSWLLVDPAPAALRAAADASGALATAVAGSGGALVLRTGGGAAGGAGGMGGVSGISGSGGSGGSGGSLRRDARFHGHRPFNSLLAFAALATACLHRRRWVVASNERSASFPTLVRDGVEINHQYTKSFAFEARFAAYAAELTAGGVGYFSLLRPLYEIQIVRIFAGMPGLFSGFMSCNRGLRSGAWCLACAKCACTYLMLSAFLSPAEVASIFRAAPAESPALRRQVGSLAGSVERPFACVATHGECRLALHLACRRGLAALARESGWDVPGDAEAAALRATYLDSLAGPHLLPEELRAGVLRFFAERVRGDGR